MSDCAAIGDSIAVGIASVAKCAQHARIGIGSEAILHRITRVSATTAIISMGSNDPRNPNLLRNLQLLRAKVSAPRVVWILPYNRQAAGAVQHVAQAHSDGVVDLAAFPSHDRVHPASYKTVARTALNHKE